jgi:phage-related protein
MTLTLTDLNGSASYSTRFVEESRALCLPERDAETVHVAGRNGDVMLDRGCYRNEKIQYDLFAFSLDEALRLADFFAATQQGYVLIQDSDAPWQRIGRPASAIPIDEIIHNKLLRFAVTFDCKPQKYFDYNGSNAGVSSVSLTPPAGYPQSEPRIEIVGTGSVTLRFLQGNITVPGLAAGLVIDTGLLLAYKTATDGTRTAVDVPFFPAFSGAATVNVTGNVTSTKIFARWCRF